MMFSALRKRIRVSPTTVIATLALVFAMTGGAYAAKKYLITSTKQISPSVLKALQGKAGAAGANGAQGAAGAQGPAGPQGAAGAGTPGKEGAPGTPGAKGTTGATGKSVELGTALGCKEGGTSVEVEHEPATEKEVCNGEKGVIHPGETLPSKASETGAWSYGEMEALKSNETAHLPTPVNITASFPIPLSAALGAGHAHFIYTNGEELVVNLGTGEVEEVHSSACEGTAAAPIVKPGNFCMYAVHIGGTLNKKALIESEPTGVLTAGNFIFPPAEVNSFGTGMTGTTGARLAVSVYTSQSNGYGTWAVTAP